MSLIDDTFIIKEDMEVRCLGTLSNEVLAKDLESIKNMIKYAQMLPFLFTYTRDGPISERGAPTVSKMTVLQLLESARKFDVKAWMRDEEGDEEQAVRSIKYFIELRGTMECSFILENAMRHSHMTTRNLVSQWQNEVDERVRYGYMV